MRGSNTRASGWLITKKGKRIPQMYKAVKCVWTRCTCIYLPRKSWLTTGSKRCKMLRIQILIHLCAYMMLCVWGKGWRPWGQEKTPRGRLHPAWWSLWGCHCKPLCVTSMMTLKLGLSESVYTYLPQEMWTGMSLSKFPNYALSLLVYISPLSFSTAFSHNSA